jgi:tRNA dimethylallyltransferase
VSLHLADALGGAEIVAADSRQLYRGLDVGTGKPDAAARARVPHHMLDLLEPSEVANAARYARAARAAIAAIRARGRAAIVVGGSGLYVRALLSGLFAGPGRDAPFRERLRARAERVGWPALHAELAARDPATAARVHPNDAVRVTRALEIIEGTGMPASEARRRGAGPPIGVKARAFAIEWPREALDERIARRFDAMLAAGLVEEVRGLLARGVAPDAPALRAPGYAEIVRHVRGDISLEEATALAVRATRRYAKRQMTWFRKVPDLAWTRAEDDAARVADAIVARLGARHEDRSARPSNPP